MMLRVLVATWLLASLSCAQAQGPQCRTSPVGASTPSCASEAFVTQSAAAKPGISGTPSVGQFALWATPTAIEGISPASKSDQQTGTSTSAAVTPSQQQSHDSAAKVWAYCTNSLGTYTLTASYNISGGSCGKVSTGVLTLTFTTAFSSTAFACLANINNAFNETATAQVASVGSVTVELFNAATGAAINDNFSVVCFGRQ